jgi:hypothetical protein
VVELPFTEALDMVACGKIRDVKTVVLLQYLKLRQMARNHAEAA